MPYVAELINHIRARIYEMAYLDSDSRWELNLCAVWNLSVLYRY